jgi:uncharacterized coiled-coil DUF342 family protein
MSTRNPGQGDIDTRLQFLLQSTESLHASMQELHAEHAQFQKELGELRNIASDSQKELGELRKVASDLATATGALLLISQSHKTRLDKLDGGNG